MLWEVLVWEFGAVVVFNEGCFYWIKDDVVVLYFCVLNGSYSYYFFSLQDVCCAQCA